jgi:hypothetical protein
VYSITCVDPVYVTQTTIAVTILHKIHYSIEVLKTKTKRIIGFQNIIGLFIITLWVLLLLLLLCATGSDVITGSYVSHVTRSDPITGSDVSHVTEIDVTGSDVIPPRFFLTIVVVQNVPLPGKLEDTKRIIRNRKSNDKQHNDQKIPKE